jgi:hypothetical protein
MTTKRTEDSEAITVASPGNGGKPEAAKLDKAGSDDAFEVFKKEDGAVDFRTVDWIPASVIFLKGTFGNTYILLGELPFCSASNPVS